MRNTGSFGATDYCELGTKFKGAHIKVFCWWIALKVNEVSKGSAPHLNCFRSKLSQDLEFKMFRNYRAGIISSKHLPKEDPVLRIMNMCCWSLARAIQAMDSGGIILSENDATAPRLNIESKHFVFIRILHKRSEIQ